MEERHKIIIPTGADPDAALSQPFFNTEATRAARPVVPLPETEATHNQAATASRPRRWAILAPLITAAVGIGVAAGLAISSYQRRQPEQQAETSVAVRPVAVKAPTTLPWTHTPEEILADEEMIASAPEAEEAQGQTPEQTPAQTPVATPPREEADRDKERREARDEKRAEKLEDRHDRRKHDEDERANEAREDERDRRRQEREQRRGRRNSQRNDDEDLPQAPLRRSRDEINRIREIFEGPP